MPFFLIKLQINPSNIKLLFIKLTTSGNVMTNSVLQVLKKTFTVIVCLFAGLPVSGQAQEVQWAHRIVEASSSYSLGVFFKEGLNYDAYPAKQLLGRPNVLPGNMGDSPNAWVPGKKGREDFVRVSFQEAMPIQQVAIGESNNPTAVKEVYAYDIQGNEYLLASLTPEDLPLAGRLLNIFFDKTDYAVKELKIVFDGTALNGFYAIDAIGISGSSVPVSVRINVADNLRDDIVVEKLNDNVNSPYVELSPIVSPDGKKLFFSRASPENVGGANDPEDIWYAEKDEETGEWKRAKNIGRPLNNEGSNFVSSVALDGETYILLLGNAYLDVRKGDMEGGVSTSTQRGDGVFSNPRPIEIEDFYNISEQAHYFLSSSQEYLMMSVERDDTKGRRDLYVSFVNEDGSFSSPVNLGSDVNTPDAESSPFLASDNETLYFSSRGYSGYGGDDVFVTRRLDDTWRNWTQPENLGPAINSELDDTFFNTSITGDEAYLSRGDMGESDLYAVRTPIFRELVPVFVVRGNVYDAETREPISAQVEFTRLDDSVTVTSTTMASGSDGSYELTLPVGRYSISPDNSNYYPLQSEIADIQPSTDSSVFVKDFYLNPREAMASNDQPTEGASGSEAPGSESSGTVGPSDRDDRLNYTRIDVEARTLKQEIVLFNFNSTSLQQQYTRDELVQVVEYLKDNPSSAVLIDGYTDNSGTSDYNYTLSERRARNVAEFLIREGVSSVRISAQGHGELDPVSTNETRAGRARNRRVEIRIVR